MSRNVIRTVAKLFCDVFFPMIDLNPSDPSYIYSTLKFVSSLAKQYIDVLRAICHPVALELAMTGPNIDSLADR